MLPITASTIFVTQCSPSAVYFIRTKEVAVIYVLYCFLTYALFKALSPVCMKYLLYFAWAGQRVQQFYNCHNVSSR